MFVPLNGPVKDTTDFVALSTNFSIVNTNGLVIPTVYNITNTTRNIWTGFKITFPAYSLYRINIRFSQKLSSNATQFSTFAAFFNKVYWMPEFNFTSINGAFTQTTVQYGFDADQGQAFVFGFGNGTGGAGDSIWNLNFDIYRIPLF